MSLSLRFCRTRTRYEDNEKAFESLVRHFGGTKRGFSSLWQAVRDAPAAEVIQAIRPSTWPEQKGPRIQKVLRRITELRGELSLDFLKMLPAKEARAWLEQLPGVGPKTSAAVLLFSSLKQPALVVDTHHYRVTLRLGLLPLDTPLARAHLLLEGLMPPHWSAQEYYDNHLVLFTHGQQCCTYARPACHRCVVLKECPYGKNRVQVSRGSA